MKDRKITSLLVILGLISLSTGIRINGEYSFLYQYTFFTAPKMFYFDIIRHQLSWLMFIHWILQFTTNVALLLLPFIHNKLKNRKLIIYIPLLFGILASWYLTLFAFILVPYLILWIILIIVNRINNNS